MAEESKKMSHLDRYFERQKMYDKAPVKGTGRPGSTAESYGYGYDPSRNSPPPQSVEKAYLEKNLRDVIPPDMDYGQVVKTYGSIEDANAYRRNYIKEIGGMMKASGDTGRGPGTRQAQIMRSGGYFDGDKF